MEQSPKSNTKRNALYDIFCVILGCCGFVFIFVPNLALFVPLFAILAIIFGAFHIKRLTGKIYIALGIIWLLLCFA